MTEDEAASFASEWIDAWNSHDLNRILSHYDEAVTFLSPVAEKRVGNGSVVGTEALRKYWGTGLSSQPDLKFEYLGVMNGHHCLTLVYLNHRQQMAAETFEFNSSNKVVRSFACYAIGSFAILK